MFYPQELLKIKVLPIKKWVLIFLSFVTIEKILYFFLFFCLTKNRMKMAIKQPTMNNMIHLLFIPRFVTSILLLILSFCCLFLFSQFFVFRFFLSFTYYYSLHIY